MEMYHKHCHIVINIIDQLLEFRDCSITQGCYLIDYFKTKMCVNVKKKHCAIRYNVGKSPRHTQLVTCPKSNGQMPGTVRRAAGGS